MLDFVIGSQGASDVMRAISLLIISGLSMRYSLTLTGQVWAKTYQQTIAFIILPVVTYVITKTISGNIALSLGMIGAMSIVRFRNPVKSALELIMYFALITIGIAASVRTKYAILLVLVIVFTIISAKIIQVIFRKYNRSFYTMSFNEGVDLNIIEIQSNEKIQTLEENINLKNIITLTSEKEFFYRLGFENRNELNELKKKIETNKNIKKIDINYV
ncbi:DUF4956 domain-containing protein [Candidatus Pelagibacter ubique]|nr:DUF4956 domain-containing protein [Candidatus Pelagibacter ubique]